MERQHLDYEVIDDFLPQKELEKLQTLLIPSTFKEGETEQVPWLYFPNPAKVDTTTKEDTWKLFYYSRLVYDQTIMFPQVYTRIVPFCELLGVKALIRIKINMYPYADNPKEHGMHIDYNFPHKAAIFSINTCDGYTKLEDGTKITSVANRMLLFDASKPHSPCTCTDQPVRVNINFNYF